jgi:ribosomal protein S18 acetylase RimI-like enzyme
MACQDGVMTDRADVRIRPFEADDRDGVLALASRLTEWVAAWREPPAVLRAAQGWVRDSMAAAGQDDHACFVAAAGDLVVGFVTVCEQRHFTGAKDACVGELAVSKAWAGRGIARRLVRTAETWAAGRGLPFITVATGAANTPARSLYASLGYREEDVQLTKPVAQTR